MTEIFRREWHKMKTGWYWYLIGFFVVVVLPYVNYYYWDGVYYNRVIEFNADINPLALVTNKDAYCPGEVIQVEQSFCKQRTIEGYFTQWWMSNGETIAMEPLSATTNLGARLPVGCYPANPEMVTLFAIHRVPQDTAPGVHFSRGFTIHYLLGDRQRRQEYATVPYIVKEPNQCVQ